MVRFLRIGIGPDAEILPGRRAFSRGDEILAVYACADTYADTYADTTSRARADS